MDAGKAFTITFKNCGGMNNIHRHEFTGSFQNHLKLWKNELFCGRIKQLWKQSKDNFPQFPIKERIKK